MSCRVALVTNTLYEGLGLAAALALAEEGFALALVHRAVTNRPTSDVDEFEARLRSLLKTRDVPHCVERLNLAEPGTAADLVNRIEGELGPIAAVVNAEGSSAFPHRDLLDTTDADWAQAVAMELVGPLNLVRACLPGMRKRRWGRVIDFVMQSDYWGSHLALRGGHPLSVDSWPFRLGKHARAGITQTLWLSERRHGITFNDLAVSRIENISLEALADEDQPPAPGTSSSVAEVVRFLCSEPGGFVTGSTLNVVGDPLIYHLPTAGA